MRKERGGEGKEWKGAIVRDRGPINPIKIVWVGHTELKREITAHFILIWLPIIFAARNDSSREALCFAADVFFFSLATGSPSSLGRSP